MVKIKIINGIYGYRPEGRMIVIPTGPKDPPIGVDEAEATRLVEIGVAQYVDESLNHHDHSHTEAVATPSAGDESEIPMDDSPGNEGGKNADSGSEDVTGHLDADSLKDWQYDDLKKLAADMGINTGKIRKKDALIDAICAVEVNAPAEAIVPGVEDVIE